MDENTPVEEAPVEIIGLSETPVTVDSAGKVTQGSAAPEQDVMADMRAAVGEPAKSEESTKVDDPPAEKVEGEKVEEKPAVKVDEAPAGDLPAGDKAPEVKPEEKDDAKSTEAKDEESEDEKKPEELTDEEKAAAEAKSEEKPVVEPSESDKLVEELGGVEVLKAVQPFVESIYEPDLPVSERVSRLEAVLPEAQMKDVRNEIFWQAAETPEIQEMLKTDPEIQEIIATDPVAREAFAQKAFGVPFDYLMHVLDEDRKDRNVFADGAFEEAVAEFVKKRKAEGADETKTPAKPVVKVEAKPTKPEAKTEEKKPEEAPVEFTPAYRDVLGDLTKDVDTIYATAQLEPDENDDADTARLKVEAAKQFAEGWAKAFLADEKAKKALDTVKGLADSGAVAQAKHKYPTLSASAKRVAAQLLEEVTKPLAQHRSKLQEKAKTAASARTEPKTVVKQQEEIIEVPIVDVSKFENEKDIERAMTDSMARHAK